MMVKLKTFEEQFPSLKGRYVVYVRKSDEWGEMCHRDIKNLGFLQLSLRPKKECWGDDWNDTPSSCNSGLAYDCPDTLKLDEDLKIYTKEQIALHCLDKQRVKEAIQKVYNSRCNTCSAEWMDFANELEKELRLE